MKTIRALGIAISAVCVAVVLFVAPPLRAADLPLKAPAAASPFLAYPNGNGWFWGVSASGLGGTTSSTGNLASGNLIGGKFSVDVGYTGNIGQGFWFVEQNFNAQAIQGPGNGLSMAATFGMEQRYAIGASQSVVSQLWGLIPGLSGVAMPSLPGLPNGLSVGPANWYGFGATYEDDVSASLGTATGKSWLFAFGAGVGALYRVSNGMVLDTSIEWKHGTQGMLIGANPLGSVNPFTDTYLATVRVKF
jgi:hypothetical protein